MSYDNNIHYYHTMSIKNLDSTNEGLNPINNGTFKHARVSQGFQLDQGASTGKVWTCQNSSGVGAWQTAGGGGANPSFAQATSVTPFSFVFGSGFQPIVFDTLPQFTVDWSITASGRTLTTTVGGLYWFSAFINFATSGQLTTDTISQPDNYGLQITVNGSPVVNGVGNSFVPTANAQGSPQLASFSGMIAVPAGGAVSLQLLNNIQQGTPPTLVDNSDGGTSVVASLSMFQLAPPTPPSVETKTEAKIEMKAEKKVEVVPTQQIPISRQQLMKKKLVTIPEPLVNMGKKNGPFPDGIMSVKFRNGKLETKKYVPESKTLEVKEQDTVNETLSSSPVLVEKPVTKVEEPKDPKMEELIKYFESLSPALREQLIKGKDKSQASSWWSLSS
jgi:hypothetical protein